MEKTKLIKKTVEHCWYYYKWHILLTVLGIVCVVSLVASFVQNRQERCLTLVAVNTEDQGMIQQTLTELYANRGDIDLLKTPIVVEGGFYQPEDMTTSTDTEVIAGLQKYSAMLTNGNFDLAISPAWSVDVFSQADAYYDLRELLSAERLEELESSLYYAQTSEGEKVPVGVMVDEADELGRFYQNTIPVLTISQYAKHVQEAVYVLEEIEIGV